MNIWNAYSWATHSDYEESRFSRDMTHLAKVLDSCKRSSPTTSNLEQIFASRLRAIRKDLKAADSALNQTTALVRDVLPGCYKTLPDNNDTVVQRSFMAHGRPWLDVVPLGILVVHDGKLAGLVRTLSGIVAEFPTSPTDPAFGTVRVYIIAPKATGLASEPLLSSSFRNHSRTGFFVYLEVSAPHQGDLVTPGLQFLQTRVYSVLTVQSGCVPCFTALESLSLTLASLSGRAVEFASVKLDGVNCARLYRRASLDVNLWAIDSEKTSDAVLSHCLFHRGEESTCFNPVEGRNLRLEEYMWRPPRCGHNVPCKRTNT